MSTPVRLERYAEMRAEMEAGRLRDEVLARFGMTIDEWLAAQRAWLERMGKELERGRFELTNRYTQAFLERQRTLSAAALPAPADEDAATLPPPAPMAPSARDSLPLGKPEVALAGATPPPNRPTLPSSPETTEPPAWMPKGMQAYLDIQGTQAPPLTPPGPALPFRDADAAERHETLPSDVPPSDVLTPGSRRACAASTMSTAPRSLPQILPPARCFHSMLPRGRRHPSRAMCRTSDYVELHRIGRTICLLAPTQVF